MKIQVGDEIHTDNDLLTVQAIAPCGKEFFCENDTGSFVKVYNGDIEMRPWAEDYEA